MTALGSIRGCRVLALACSVCGLALLAPSDATPRPAPPNGLPALMLWAWERPEDFRELDQSVGIAFLAQTITLADDRMSVQPRRQPLRVAPGARLMAVTRIEIMLGAPGPPNLSTVETLAAMVVETRTLPLDARAGCGLR